MNWENVSSLLDPGEQILWASASAPGRLMDRENRARNLRWFSLVGAGAALLAGLYVRACIRTGTSVFSVIAVVFVLLSAIVFLDPIATLQKLRHVEYAITNRRVIVCASAYSSFSLPIAKAGHAHLVEDRDGGASLVFSPEKPVKPGKLRTLGLLGCFVAEDGGTVRYPVLYRVSDARQALHILENAQT